jgi:hypothetical protein
VVDAVAADVVFVTRLVGVVVPVFSDEGLGVDLGGTGRLRDCCGSGGVVDLVMLGLPVIDRSIGVFVSAPLLFTNS